MSYFFLRRLLLIPISMFIVVSLSFGLVNVLPGDPALTIAGSFATQERVHEIREELDLNRPLHARYRSYVADTLTGDLGTSFFRGTPIRGEIARRLPHTVELVLLALIGASVMGLILGITSAYFEGKALDRLGRLLVTVLQSVPDFLLALLGIYVLFYIVGWVPPPVGRVGLLGTSVKTVTGFLLVDSLIAGDFDSFVQVLHHTVLPALSLALVYSAYVAKVTRSTMAKALKSEQVVFARACGLSELQCIRYAFSVARTPILTYGAILLGALIGGAAIIETIFTWGGIGDWALRAMLDLDLPVIQAFILVAGTGALGIYLILDIVVALLDPRVRYYG